MKKTIVFASFCLFVAFASQYPQRLTFETQKYSLVCNRRTRAREPNHPRTTTTESSHNRSNVSQPKISVPRISFSLFDSLLLMY